MSGEQLYLSLLRQGLFKGAREVAERHALDREVLIARLLGGGA